LERSDELIISLQNNVKLFKQKINPGLPLLKSDSAIQCLILGSNDKAKQMARYIQDKGMDVRAILSPTVPQGTERLRICLHAFNHSEEIDLLANTINEFANAG